MRITNKAVCAHSRHYDCDDNKKHIGISQFFACQNFPNPDSSKFFTVKILHHIYGMYYLDEILLLGPLIKGMSD